MELKTKIHAEDGKQELTITREFELPVELLFKAYEDADIVAQWMSTTVVKLENKKYGSWQFDTSDDKGNIVFSASGVYHEFVPNKKITRTFEMGNAPFDVQLEFLEFEALDEDRSKLTMQIVYRSGALRDQMLKLPFKQGLNMAHNRLEALVKKLNS
ncbi:SRPBCC family protein [Chitinophaga silvisoli]|uniref:ATPase n=1 Tax=Chitinophaga silvisoli TaxID=2291814 RepID=A0A3E1NYK0_9BACT|nr:SRPBCC domain-containing protein [Chitinophaga silvisoli]RFM33003.1 ATPase [Chitinophaga silvisoli]